MRSSKNTFNRALQALRQALDLDMIALSPRTLPASTHAALRPYHHAPLGTRGRIRQYSCSAPSKSSPTGPPRFRAMFSFRTLLLLCVFPVSPGPPGMYGCCIRLDNGVLANAMAPWSLCRGFSVPWLSRMRLPLLLHASPYILDYLEPVYTTAHIPTGRSLFVCGPHKLHTVPALQYLPRPYPPPAPLPASEAAAVANSSRVIACIYVLSITHHLARIAPPLELLPTRERQRTLPELSLSTPSEELEPLKHSMPF